VTCGCAGNHNEADGNPDLLTAAARVPAGVLCRHRIGLDVCLEALRAYWRRRHIDVPALRHFASIDRVSRVMQPYLESMQ